MIPQINSDELAELLEDEPGLYVELPEDDPDTILICWPRAGCFDSLFLCWEEGQTFIITSYLPDAPFGTLDLGTGDIISVDSILNIVSG